MFFFCVKSLQEKGFLEIKVIFKEFICYKKTDVKLTLDVEYSQLYIYIYIYTGWNDKIVVLKKTTQ